MIILRVNLEHTLLRDSVHFIAVIQGANIKHVIVMVEMYAQVEVVVTLVAAPEDQHLRLSMGVVEGLGILEAALRRFLS